MSVYTTQVRYICETACGLSESAGYNDVNDIIERAIPSIFNFTFPIFDENYRAVLEKKILKHFYTREIGLETVGLWKLKLDTKLNEIMPYYNQLYQSELIEFNPMYAMDYSKLHMGSRNDTGSDSISNNGSRTNNVTGSNNNTELFSDTPQGSVQNLNENGYLTTATKNNGSNSMSQTETNTNTMTGSNSLNSTDEYTDRVYGYAGYNASRLLTDFRKTFLNIDMQIINDLEVLFMQVW